MQRDIKGFEGFYYVTDCGEVYSYDRYVKNSPTTGFNKKGCRIKPFFSGGRDRDYETVALNVDSVTYKKYIHRLVAEAFIENPLNMPQVNHKNCDKKDNSIENLEWCTASQNGRHARDNKRLKTSKLTPESVEKIREFLKTGMSQEKIGKLFDVSQYIISAIKLKKIWL